MGQVQIDVYPYSTLQMIEQVPINFLHIHEARHQVQIEVIFFYVIQTIRPVCIESVYIQGKTNILYLIFGTSFNISLFADLFIVDYILIC